MVREIVTDPILLAQRSETADKTDGQVMTDLLDTLKANAYRCVGMAANMIGVRKTILAARTVEGYIVMVNPEVIAHSHQPYEAEEGCLCHEGKRKTMRYKSITVVYLDERFKRKKQTFRDFEAQIIQHEMDHFQGILV